MVIRRKVRAGRPGAEGRRDRVWKSASLARNFLEGVRGGIPLAAEQVDVMLRLIEARDGAVKNFADLGCGNGILARAILDRFPNARGILLDFSETMLKEARTHLGAYGARADLVSADFGRNHWVRSVAHRAPFDVIVSGYAIHHQPDTRKRAIYREAYELLNPGGIFLNVEHVSSATRWVESVHDELVIDSLHAFHRGKGSGKSRAEIARKHHNRRDKDANILAPVEAQCRWLRECGFGDVDCYIKIFELAVFGGRRPKARARKSGTRKELI
ncbi:MAG: class I SAM-dependent methyltransferase [Vicinamibacteria bacterium]